MRATCLAMKIRKPSSKSVEKEVVVASRRRCCLCVFLAGRDDVRKGQIAHLNGDPSDSCFENLVFLCFEHHDEYDSQPSQSKGLTLEEVKEYRDRLYSKNGQSPTSTELKTLAQSVELSPLPETSEYEEVRIRFSKELEF